MYTVKRTGKKDFIVVCDKTGEIIEPTCPFFTCPEDYESAEYIPVEPMSAKEPLNEEQQEEMFNSLLTIAEEKFDGVRGTFHIKEHENRIFSRRISKKTNWYGDNTDRLVHFRDFLVPHLDGTVIDGELIIPDTPLQDISGMLNMDWDKAIERQKEIGFCHFVVFDIIYYKGLYIAKMPLKKRKKYMEKVVAEMNNPLIKVGEYIYDFVERPITPFLLETYENDPESFRETYPNLCKELETTNDPTTLTLDKQQWYEYVVLHGGEGLMLKYDDKTYEHKRTRSYTKIKKFSTWDVVITRFIEPTKEYTGKDDKNWEYRDEEGNPVTKHYYMNWVGTVAYGVVVTEAEFIEWKKNNPKEKYNIYTTLLSDLIILEVGDCSGFDEDVRAYMTQHQDELIGKVIEIKAQEVLKTGKLRHPRFIRFRDDKDAYQCIYEDHMRK